MCYKQGNGKTTFDKDFDIVSYFFNKGYKITSQPGGYKIKGKKRSINLKIFAEYRCIDSCWYIVQEDDEYEVIEQTNTSRYGYHGNDKQLKQKRLTLEDIIALVDKKIKKPKEVHVIKSKKLRKLYNYFEDFEGSEEWYKNSIQDLIKEADEGIL